MRERAGFRAPKRIERRRGSHGPAHAAVMQQTRPQVTMMRAIQRRAPTRAAADAGHLRKAKGQSSKMPMHQLNSASLM